jgi:hypothetical protein
MKKNNKIWFMIWFGVGISFLIFGCSSKSGVEGKKWFKFASQYDQACHRLWASGGALNEYNEMTKIGQKFLKTGQPTEDEMISVLKSPDKKIQIVGLAAMYIKPLETEQLTDILFEFIQGEDPEFRWYARNSLLKIKNFPENKKDDLGKKLLEIVKGRKDSELSIEEVSLLAKFPSKEAASFLTGLFMKEGDEENTRLFRVLAFRSLKEMGDSFFDEAAEYIRNHGSPEIQNEFTERVKSWKELHTPTGKE